MGLSRTKNKESRADPHRFAPPCPPDSTTAQAWPSFPHQLYTELNNTVHKIHRFLSHSQFIQSSYPVQVEISSQVTMASVCQCVGLYGTSFLRFMSFLCHSYIILTSSSYTCTMYACTMYTHISRTHIFLVSEREFSWLILTRFFEIENYRQCLGYIYTIYIWDTF